MKHIAIGILYFVIGFSACTNHAELFLEEADVQEICKLAENISTIKMPQSLDVLDRNHFVVTDWEGVYLYDFNGIQLRQIGKSGRAQFEYNRPSAVRVYGNNIYVWSSATLKFIEFLSDGTPVAEYPYPSAVTDFRVSSDNIYIYTAGRRYKNIIDVYDKVSMEVKVSLTQSSKEHRFNLHNISSSPIYSDGESLVYAAKDNMTLYCYRPDSDSAVQVSDFTSETFEVEAVADTNMLFTNWDKALKYYNENPITLFVSPSEKGYYLLTAEGCFAMENNEQVDGTRYIGLYEVQPEGGKRIAAYTYSSVGTQYVYASFGKDIYFIRHSISDNDDVYTLNRLKLD